MGRGEMFCMPRGNFMIAERQDAAMTHHVDDNVAR